MTSLTLVRRIAARPSIVYEALTTAAGVAAWWGPDDLPVLVAEIDARVGGAYRVRFRTLDGQEHEACGEYLEVVPQRRLVMSWRYAYGGEPEEFGRTSRIEIELTPIAGGVELTLTHTALKNAASETSHRHGWTGSLDKLVRQLGGAPDK
jgi:uncharacterized protein YndB with AHSA1/START domain